MKRKNKIILCGAGFLVAFCTVIFVSIISSDGRNSLLQVENPFRVLAQSINQESLPEMKNPSIIIRKEKRQLELFDGDNLIKTYKIALGFAPVGDKEREGDGKTPEGEFYIFTKNPNSRFYLSLGISYPSVEDAERGLKNNLISEAERDQIIEAIKNKRTPLQKTKLGGEIYIHGSGALTDWTQGCVAVSNADMKELFDIIPVGTKVEILP